ncbi:hypothetical protein G7Z17_g2739 [Cylindrodendrum hubeiense]|uniref:LTD domain-containing protein n=1 Tax=Cylindrodendrum hubeiense TaxID=595255 RepID=A0A9P5HC71_9HYPO|nr:hypothetical protein G7Z17_g2739 [Cylindrodendrum hubeiense]
MPLMNYGVWKAKPTGFEVERTGKSPHAQLYCQDGGKMKIRAAINVKSLDSDDSKLVYWLLQSFDHPIREKLKGLTTGWHDMCLGASHERISLDLLRDSLVDLNAGTVAEHNVDGPDNDVSDAIEKFFLSIEQKRPTVYLFGEKFFNWDENEEGVHDIHMNQGSRDTKYKEQVKRFSDSNATHQDGGIILEYPDHWEAFLTAFSSQAMDSDPEKGEPIGKTFGPSPPPPPPHPPTPDVAIVAAIINSAGPDGPNSPEEVHLRNKSGVAVSLKGWRIGNDRNKFFSLPDESLPANGGRAIFQIPGVPLGNGGGKIILVNGEQEVDSVTYTASQVGRDGELVDFKRDGS